VHFAHAIDADAPENIGTLQRFASGVEGFVNLVLNKIDALLTLTGFSSVADEAALPRDCCRFNLNNLQNHPTDR
jgi:hypothetical protein